MDTRISVGSAPSGELISTVSPMATTAPPELTMTSTPDAEMVTGLAWLTLPTASASSIGCECDMACWPVYSNVMLCGRSPPLHTSQSSGTVVVVVMLVVEVVVAVVVVVVVVVVEDEGVVVVARPSPHCPHS
jgi:hypothetical protein